MFMKGKKKVSTSEFAIILYKLLADNRKIGFRVRISQGTFFLQGDAEF